MNYIDTLSEDERLIIKLIVHAWKDKSASNSLGIHLYELLDKMMLKNSIQTDIEYQIDLDGGEIQLYHFFNTYDIENTFGNNTEHIVKDVTKRQLRTFIIVSNFVSKLYQDGLVYFPEESFEESKFEDWGVHIDSYPKPTYTWEISNICSNKIAKFLDSFLQSAICPSFQLIELCEHNFESVETRRYNTQKFQTDVALKRAKCANIIAIIIAIVSMIATIACALTIPTSINKEQYQELIETIKIYNNE